VLSHGFQSILCICFSGLLGYYCAFPVPLFGKECIAVFVLAKLPELVQVSTTGIVSHVKPMYHSTVMTSPATNISGTRTEVLLGNTTLIGVSWAGIEFFGGRPSSESIFVQFRS
jgi:hypothetical protein